MSTRPSVPVVLVACSTEALADNLRELLVDEGLEVRLAQYAAKATSLLDGADVVLTDLGETSSGGVELIRLAKQGSPERPVIAYVAHATKAELDRAERAGVSDILEMPGSIERLIETVTKRAERSLQPVTC